MSDQDAENAASELTAPVDLRSAGLADRRFKLAATPQECALIAKRLMIPGVGKLEGEISLTASKTELKAVGELHAELTRECVASLEEMAETVDEVFEVVFMRAVAGATAEAVEEEFEDWDAPEVHEGDVFDLGDFLIQQLALAMEPFPRKEGAQSLVDQYGQDKSISPFAVLAEEDENS